MIATPMLYLLCLHYTMYTLDLLCEVEFHRVQVYSVYSPWVTDYNVLLKVIMQGKLFHWCTHLLFCSVLSIGGKVNTRRMSKSDMGSIFHIKKPMKYSGHRKLLCELSTKRTLMHLFLFTNFAQRELISICTQSIHNCN